MPEALKVFSIVAYSLIFVLGTIGNGLVIFIMGFRMKKTVNTVWILNLAIADFTFSFFLLFNIVRIAENFHWQLGPVMCKLNYAMVFFNVIASIYTLTVISIDRCIAVWCPVWAQNHRTPRLASFVVLGIWILALVLCCLNLYSMKKFTYIKNETCCFNHYNMPYAEETKAQYALVTTRVIISFIIPFIVIVVCYGAIVVRLRRDQLSQSSKPFKVITAVIVAFFVCWLPFHIFSFLQVKNSSEAQKHVVSIGLPLSVILASFNSCLNPILYFCMGYNFKEKLRLSLLSVLVNAFTESSTHSNTKAESSAELDSPSK
ncbi:chemerin-like receptor 1 [Tiliqua scincoides]|uniref:chemerin-like receptor 1 n=1 Tax=Tiliqua scincoides TaxID=71010 RepID=UPI003462F545